MTDQSTPKNVTLTPDEYANLLEYRQNQNLERRKNDIREEIVNTVDKIRELKGLKKRLVIELNDLNNMDDEGKVPPSDFQEVSASEYYYSDTDPWANMPWS